MALPTNLVATATNNKTNIVNKSVRLKIIEETALDVFVAIPTDQGGPTNWSMWHTPQVTAVQRGAIMSAVYLPCENTTVNQAAGITP
jgi:hypothetical protein